MPVDSKHSEYIANSKQWKKIRDALAGEEQIKAAGELYLPKPSGLTQEQYDAYKERAMFFGASRRTVTGLTGAIFRKDPESILPTKKERLERNIDLAGTDIAIFSRAVVREVISMARYGVLVDITNDGRGYMAGYVAEDITNWRTTVINGIEVLSQVILKETVEVPADDGFGSDTETRYRVLELDEQENGQYYYVVRIFEDDGGWKEVETIEPTMRGKRLEFIPFQFIGVDNLEPDVDQSPINELVDVNISHYRTQADLEHGAHWTALPTPYVTGYRGGEEDGDGGMIIGSQTAWALANADSKVGMLEFTGAGLKALENRADKKEQLMVLLGARLLEDQKKAAETAESKRIQYSGENSILAQIVNTVSMAITQCLAWAIRWEENLNEDPDNETVKFQLNNDFFDDQLSPNEIKELVAAWQTGAMSKKTMLWNFKRGELLPPEKEIDTEIEDIENEGPSLSDLAGVNDNLDAQLP